MAQKLIEEDNIPPDFMNAYNAVIEAGVEIGCITMGKCCLAKAYMIDTMHPDAPSKQLYPIIPSLIYSIKGIIEYNSDKIFCIFD